MARSPLRALALLSLVGLTVVGSQAAAAAPATTTVTLPLNGFFQMLVDPTSHHVFVDGDPTESNDAIVVLDAGGSVDGSISGESDAGGMVVDGSTLYVARCGQGVIDEIDTTTLEKVGSISASVGGTCRLGLAGGRLWYPTTSGYTPIDTVTIAAPNTVATDQIPVSLEDPTFLGVPNNPNELWVGETTGTFPKVELVDASQATPTIIGNDAFSGISIDDWALSSDAQTMYLADGASQLLALNTAAHLGSAAYYTTGSFARAVDLSPSGDEVVGGVDENASNVQEFSIASGKRALAATTADAPTPSTPAGGVRYSEDGSQIFSITTDPSEVVELHVTDARAASTLTVSAGGANTALTGSTVRLTGALHVPSGGTLSSQTVTVTATTPLGAVRTIGTATTNGLGNWGITTPALKPGGQWTFHATYTGGAFADSSASVGVRVGLPEPLLTVTAGASTVNYGSGIVLTVHLGKWQTNRTVTIYKSTSGSAPVKLASGSVSSRGTFSYTAHPGMKTVYTARFTGDDTYLAKASAGKVIFVRARLSITQSGYYRTSGAVRLYHYSSKCWTNQSYCPHLTGHLAPALSGRPVRYTLEKLVSGRWVSDTAVTVYTVSNGLSGIVYQYTGVGLIGHELRVHAVWTGNGDWLTATSPWVEFELTH